MEDENTMEKMTENEIRDMPNPESDQPRLTMKRGKTTFLIGLHFADKGKETLEDKVKRMISKDVQDGNF